MRRIIDIVSESYPLTSDGTNGYKQWHSDVVHDFGESEGWIIDSAYQSLWPYSNPPNKGMLEIIMYPHIFWILARKIQTSAITRRGGVQHGEISTFV